METPTAHPAPLRPLPVVAGDLALDFANTVDDPWGPACFDHIGDVPRLVRWAGLVGVLGEEEVELLLADLPHHPRRAAVQLERGHALRATLETVFGAVADHQDVPAGAWVALRSEVAEAVTRAALAVGDGAAQLTWSPDLEGVLDRVAYAAHRLLTGDELHRLKRCAACPWVYLDRSKNQSRRWCAMDDCGKHEKMRRYVERRAARRRSAVGSAG